MDTKSIVVWNVFWLEVQSTSVRIEEDCYIRSEDIAFICVHGHKAKTAPIGVKIYAEQEVQSSRMRRARKRKRL